MRKLCAAVSLILLFAGVQAAAGEQAPPELAAYVERAKKLGLSDDQIRKNAASAGWDPKLVDEAFAMARQGTPSAGADSNLRASAPALPDGYRIGPGDSLQISVWREPDASVPAVTVRTDGKISLPLIKEVEIVGLTPAEAERMLSQRLSRYIHNADVTVIVREIHSRKVYLVGAVKAVAPIVLAGPMTVLQAITAAGGLTDYAKRKQIYVLRTENGRQVKLPFNYEAVIKGENTEQNIQLHPNDTIVVPQ